MGALKQLRRATGAALCVECGKCSTLCPLAPFGDFSAARTMSMHDPASEIPEYADAVERCLTCGSCEIRCPQGVRYTEFVRGLRPMIPEGSRRPRPHGEVFQAVGKSQELDDRRRPVSTWLGGDLEIASEGEIGLFIGCLPMFDVVFQNELGVDSLEIARAAIRILNRLGIAPVIVDHEVCCGHDLLWGGEREAFESLARANCSQFRKRGIRHLLTVCAECCRTWRLDYPEVDADYRPQVEHMTEFLWRRVEAGELQFSQGDDGRVTFQDPCRLGRQLGVIDEPRQLLQAVPGIDLREMERSGRDAQCCGTTGFVHCDAVSRRLQAQRLRSAADTGAERLLTACPKCLLHFCCARTEDQRRGRQTVDIEIEDLTVYLADHLTAGESSHAEVGDPQTTTGEQP